VASNGGDDAERLDFAFTAASPSIATQSLFHRLDDIRWRVWPVHRAHTMTRPRSRAPGFRDSWNAGAIGKRCAEVTARQRTCLPLTGGNSEPVVFEHRIEPAGNEIGHGARRRRRDMARA